MEAISQGGLHGLMEGIKGAVAIKSKIAILNQVQLFSQGLFCSLSLPWDIFSDITHYLHYWDDGFECLPKNS